MRTQYVHKPYGENSFLAVTTHHRGQVVTDHFPGHQRPDVFTSHRAWQLKAADRRNTTKRLMGEPA